MTGERRLTWRLPTRGTPAKTGISTGYGRGCSVRRSSTRPQPGGPASPRGRLGGPQRSQGTSPGRCATWQAGHDRSPPAALSSSRRRASRLNGVSSPSINATSTSSLSPARESSMLSRTETASARTEANKNSATTVKMVDRVDTTSLTGIRPPDASAVSPATTASAGTSILDADRSSAPCHLAQTGGFPPRRSSPPYEAASRRSTAR